MKAIEGGDEGQGELSRVKGFASRFRFTLKKKMFDLDGAFDEDLCLLFGSLHLFCSQTHKVLASHTSYVAVTCRSVGHNATDMGKRRGTCVLQR